MPLGLLLPVLSGLPIAALTPPYCPHNAIAEGRVTSNHMWSLKTRLSASDDVHPCWQFIFIWKAWRQEQTTWTGLLVDWTGLWIITLNQDYDQYSWNEVLWRARRVVVPGITNWYHISGAYPPIYTLALEQSVNHLFLWKKRRSFFMWTFICR